MSRGETHQTSPAIVIRCMCLWPLVYALREQQAPRHPEGKLNCNCNRAFLSFLPSILFPAPAHAAAFPRGEAPRVCVATMRTRGLSKAGNKNSACNKRANTTTITTFWSLSFRRSMTSRSACAISSSTLLCGIPIAGAVRAISNAALGIPRVRHGLLSTRM